MRTNDLPHENSGIEHSGSPACYLVALMLTPTQEQAIRNVFAREEAGTPRSDLWDTEEAEHADYEFVAELWRAKTGDTNITDQDAANLWLSDHYDEFCSR